MKYQPRHYAKALELSMRGKGKKERRAIARRFLSVLERHRATHRLETILHEFERQECAARGLKKITITSAAPLTAAVRRSIMKFFSGHAFLKEVTAPELLAGIQITVDDELFIDASGRRQLDRIFKNPSHV